MSARIGSALIAGIVLGAFAGFGLERLCTSDDRAGSPAHLAAPATAPRTSERELPAALAPAATVPARERDADGESAREPTSADVPLISAALRDHARDGIARGWSTLRSDPVPHATMTAGLAQFEQMVLRGPEGIGSHLAEQASRAEREGKEFRTLALAGDPVVLLERLNDGGVGPQVDFVADAAAYGRLFPTTTGASAGGSAHLRDADDVVEDGTSLVFPAGVFRVSQLMRMRDPFPRDITIRGAGMNATLLFVENLSTRGELRNFAIEDCTLFSAPLLDLRNRPASLRLERVRAIGFDCGAGGSTLIDARGIAVLARGCAFEGGYGRGQGGGGLFDVRSDALLARFEECSFDLIELRTNRLRPGCTLAFVRCALTNILDRTWVESMPHPGVLFEGSTIDYRTEEPGPLPRKDLDALFPAWEQRLRD